MIYEKITKEINDFLGEDFILKYANNIDLNWEDILKDIKEEIAYGVLRVDSGTTTQLADTTIRTEQLTLEIAIPADRKIFDKDIAALKAMLNGLNNLVVYDEDEDAKLLFGERQDSRQQLVNGTYWWMTSVVFTANFYSSLYLSSDVLIKINNTKLQGLFKVNYTREFVIDPEVILNTGLPQNKVNNIRKNLVIDGVCLKTDTLIKSLFEQEDTITTYAVYYDDQIVVRQFNAILPLINEQAIMGDVIKVTLSFLRNS